MLFSWFKFITMWIAYWSWCEIQKAFERNILKLPINQQTKIYTQQSIYVFCIIYSKQLGGGGGRSVFLNATRYLPSPNTNKRCFWNMNAPDNNLFSKMVKVTRTHILIPIEIYICHSNAEVQHESSNIII